MAKYSIVLIMILMMTQVAHGQKAKMMYDESELNLDLQTLARTGYYTETQDGYTVIHGSDGRWYYAKINEYGNLVSAGMLVSPPGRQTSNERRFLRTAKKRLGNEEIIRERERIEQKRMEQDLQILDKWNRQSQFSLGVRQVLVLCIQFPDAVAAMSLAGVDSMMNINTWDGTSGTGGFKDYFTEVSYGQFVPQSHVYGWYTAKHSLAHYTDVLGGSAAAGSLFVEALDQVVAAGIDLSPFDNDGDGKAEAVILQTSRSIRNLYRTLPSAASQKFLDFDILHS